MSYGSLTKVGKIEIAKLMKNNFEFYIALGGKPDDYVDLWDIDENTPAYIAKKITNEVVVRGVSGVEDPLVNNDLRSVLEVYTNPTSAVGTLNSYFTITAAPGTQGNIQVRLQPGALAGSETVDYATGVLTVNIENAVSTRAQVRQALLTSPLIQAVTIASAPDSPVTMGLEADSTSLVGGKNTKQFTEGQHFQVGYLDNENSVTLGNIKWIDVQFMPSAGETYYVSYWYKTLLSEQDAMLLPIGFKKAVSVDYVVEDDNGAIITNDKKWSTTTTPSKNLLLRFFINNLDVANGTVIRQHSIYVGTTPTSNLGADHFYTIAELSAQGTLLHLENISPYKHEIIIGTTLNLVISL